MMHPSYKELMAAVNKDVPEGEDPVVNSRYSIVMGTAKRARQLVAADRCIYEGEQRKALSIAVAELQQGNIHIIAEGEDDIHLTASEPGSASFSLDQGDEDEAEDIDEEEGEDADAEDAGQDDGEAGS